MDLLLGPRGPTLALLSGRGSLPGSLLANGYCYELLEGLRPGMTLKKFPMFRA